MIVVETVLLAIISFGVETFVDINGGIGVAQLLVVDAVLSVRCHLNVVHTHLL